jgi:hypothetical protein
VCWPENEQKQQNSQKQNTQNEKKYFQVTANNFLSEMKQTRPIEAKPANKTI